MRRSLNHFNDGSFQEEWEIVETKGMRMVKYQGKLSQIIQIFVSYSFFDFVKVSSCFQLI